MILKSSFIFIFLLLLFFNAESGPVMNFIIRSLNDSSVMISWMPPSISNGVITSYRVMIFKLEGNAEVLNVNTASGSQTTFMTSNLGMC